MTSKLTRSLLSSAAAGLSLSLLSVLPAGAHGSAEHGVIDGALHPLLGLDHLLMLVAIGLCAAQAGRQILGYALAGALIGSVFGSFGGQLPGAEVLAALALSAVAAVLVLVLRGLCSSEGSEGEQAAGQRQQSGPERSATALKPLAQPGAGADDGDRAQQCTGPPEGAAAGLQAVEQGVDRNTAGHGQGQDLTAAETAQHQNQDGGHGGERQGCQHFCSRQLTAEAAED